MRACVRAWQRLESDATGKMAMVQHDVMLQRLPTPLASTATATSPAQPLPREMPPDPPLAPGLASNY